MAQCANPEREGEFIGVCVYANVCVTLWEGGVSRKWTACRVFIARPL